MTSRSANTADSQFRNMLRISREIGCQIQPGTENPNILTGLCPFHDAKTLHEAKTLHVNLVTTRFWCISCHTSGNPLGFIAKVWGVTANEAYQFVRDGYEITVERPRRKKPEEEMHPNVAPQNSALLTMGTRYYGQQVKQSFPALHYLARLGVEPDAAIRAGFGYCPGEGLKEYLEQRKADPEEIEESTLFQDITGMEFLAGCITLSDLDFTGATIWMIGLLPDEDNQQSWNAARPRNRSIQGKRNRFFNMTNIRENEHGITVTDDPRLYLLMKASGMTPAMFISQRTEGNGYRIAVQAGSLLMSRYPGSVILAMHDRATQADLARRLKQIKQDIPCEHRSRDEMLQQLAPHTRNLADFTSLRGNTEMEHSPWASRPPAENGNREEIPASIPAENGNREEIPASILAENGDSEEIPASIPAENGDNEEIPASPLKEQTQAQAQVKGKTQAQRRAQAKRRARAKSEARAKEQIQEETGDAASGTGGIRTEEIAPAQHQSQGSGNAGT